MEVDGITGAYAVRLRNISDESWSDWINIDSELYQSKIPKIKQKPQGIIKMINLIKKSVPKVRFGYFNSSKERFYSPSPY